MAKLRETSVQNKLTLKEDNGSSDITIENIDGKLNINTNLNVDLDVSANSLTLPGGGININDNIDISKKVESYNSEVISNMVSINHRKNCFY